MLNNFFDDEETATHIKIDMNLYESILSDYAGSFKKEKMASIVTWICTIHAVYSYTHKYVYIASTIT